MVGEIVGCESPRYSDPADGSDGGDAVPDLKEGFNRARGGIYLHQTQAEQESQSNLSSFWHLKVPCYR